MGTVQGSTTDEGTPGVRGDSEKWNGVLGVSRANGHAGVAGVAEQGGNGVYGRGTANGVWGHGYSSPNAIGVVGVSDHNDGVAGISTTVGKSGVIGVHNGQNGQGVWGQADKGTGVVGLSQTGAGVYGRSEAGEGIRGESRNPNHGGIVGISSVVGGHGVFGTCDEGTGVIAVTKKGNALFAKADQGKAGHFQGDVEVTGRFINPGLEARITQIDTATQKIAALEQKIASLQNQLNIAIQNLTTRVTLVEFKVISHTHTIQRSVPEVEMALARAGEVSPSPVSVLADEDHRSFTYPEAPSVNGGQRPSSHPEASPI